MTRSEDLHGDGKTFHGIDSSRTIEDCAEVCNAREGCTGFEYAESGIKQGQCATYTGGENNIRKDENRNAEFSIWRSCLKSGF